MSDDKSSVVVSSPRKSAKEWFDLYRSGKRELAAAHLAAEVERSREAVNESVDDRLKEMEKAWR